MSYLTYLEFNLLYHRYEHMKDINHVEYMRSTDQYVLTYTGVKLNDVSMLIHHVSLLDDSHWLVTPYTLSEIFLNYPQLHEVIDLTEELSDDYIKFIFHKLTKRGYLKYLSEQELIDYENFLNRKVRESEVINEREVRRLSKEESDDSFRISQGVT